MGHGAMTRWASTFAVLIAVAMFLAALVYATQLIFDLLGGLV